MHTLEEITARRAVGYYDETEMATKTIVALYPAANAVLNVFSYDDDIPWTIINASEDEIIAYISYGPYTDVLAICYTGDDIVSTLRTMGLRD